MPLRDFDAPRVRVQSDIAELPHEDMLNNGACKGTLILGVWAKDKTPPVRADAFPAIVSKWQLKRDAQMRVCRAVREGDRRALAKPRALLDPHAAA